MEIRTQYPRACWNSADWDNSVFYPSPAWGTFGNTDYPTVVKHNPGTAGDITRTVQFYDGSTYNLRNRYGAQGINIDQLYTGKTQNSAYQIKHGKGVGADFLAGHKGPASSSSTRLAWQRNVIGISYNWHMGNANTAGIRLKNVILLYRHKDWTNKFAGAWLAKDHAIASLDGSIRYKTLGSNPFSDNSYISGSGSSGKTTFCLTDSARNWIMNNALVYQGVWFEFDALDPVQAQTDNRYYIWNFRLAYDPDPASENVTEDLSHRIVLPRNWRFDNAWDRFNTALRLT